MVSCLSFVLVAVMTTVSFLCPSDWKMSLAKATWSWSVGWTIWMLSAQVLANQLFHQSYPEVFHGLVQQVSVATTDNKPVSYHKIEQEPEYILVIFFTFWSYMVIAS